VEGFTSSTVCPICSLQIDAQNGNSLTASVPGPAVPGETYGGELAWAMTTSPHLPQLDQGKIFGHIVLPLGAPLNDQSFILSVLNGSGGIILQVDFDDAQTLRYTSGAGILDTGGNTPALSSTSWPQVSPLLAAGVDNTLAFRWKQGGFFDLLINGQSVNPMTLSSFSQPGAATPQQLQLGINTAGPSTDAGFTVRLYGWQMSGDPDAQLGP
jgi:hypothetical protein